MRRQSFFLFKKKEGKFRKRDTVFPSLFHRLGRDQKGFLFDPVFPERCRLTRAKHRDELKKKEHLHASRGRGHHFHDGGKFLPVDGRHRLHDGRGEDAGNALDGIVLDVAGADREVEDLPRSHEHAL